MKKLVLIIIVFIFVVFSVFSDENKLSNVPKDYVGSYVPVEYENLLKEKGLHYLYQTLYHKADYPNLLLSEDSCYYYKEKNIPIINEDFSKFNFFSNSNGKYIIDINGNSYKQISKKADSNELEKYICLTLFKNLLDLKNTYWDDEKHAMVVEGEYYYPDIDNTQLEKNEYYYVLILLNGKALVKDGLSAKLYDTEIKNNKLVSTFDVLKHFPLFSFNKEQEHPNIYSDSEKEDLRYARNYYYAKYGYTFKDKKLQAFFERYTWYKKNPSFSESVITWNEKSTIERIQYYEQSLQ